MSVSMSRGFAAVSVASLPFFSSGCYIVEVMIAVLSFLGMGSPSGTYLSDSCPARIICPVPYCRVAIQNGSFERGSLSTSSGIPEINPVVWRRGARSLHARNIDCQGRYGLHLNDRSDFVEHGLLQHAFQVIDLNDIPLAGPDDAPRRVRAVASFVAYGTPEIATLRMRVLAFSGVDPNSFPNSGDPGELAHQAIEVFTEESSSPASSVAWKPVELVGTLPDGTDVIVLALDVVFDGDPADVDVYVDGVNLVVDTGPFGPSAAPDRVVAKAGVPVVIDVLANDSDPDAPIDGSSLELVVVPAHGNASDAGGVITYTATDGYVGSDNLSYRFSDADGLAAGALVTIDVVENAPPTAVRDVYTLPLNGTLNVAAAAGVLSNDTDAEGDVLTAELVDQPRSGLLTTFEPDGAFAYQAGTGFTGSDWFTYRVTDGNAFSDKAYVYVVGNKPPVAFGDVFHVTPGAIDTLDVLYNDSDPDGDVLSIALFGQPANGNIATTSDGKVRFEASAGFSGVVAFPYTANDGRGGASPATEVQVQVSSAPPYDLGVTAVAAPDTIFFGQSAVYTVVVSNNGPSDATDVIVSFPLPPSQFDIVDIQVTQGLVDPSWNVGTLAAGQTATMTATVEPLVAPLLIRNARITSGLGADDDHRNNTARAALVVRVD